MSINVGQYKQKIPDLVLHRIEASLMKAVGEDEDDINREILRRLSQ